MLTILYSNGTGFSAIDVGNFTATLIQAADGVFVSILSLDLLP